MMFWVFWDDTHRTVLGAEHASICAGRLIPNRSTEENREGKATAMGEERKAHRLNLFHYAQIYPQNTAISPYSHGLLRNGVQCFKLPLYP
jgi:hypothetical protein